MSFNRTFMELKLDRNTGQLPGKKRFNRTFMELKYIKQRAVSEIHQF